jgi:peptide/nickel transport system substrate-binding protein
MASYFMRLSRRLTLAMLAAGFAAGVQAADLKGGTLRVALLADVVNYDPMQFSSVNAPIMKNLYDTLLDAGADGLPVPALASAYEIAPDNLSVTITLRAGVLFQSGAPLDTAALVATLKKAMDPAKGKNVYPTMAVVKDWVVVDAARLKLNFSAPVPDRQITDILQFMPVIEASGVDTVETKTAGTGPFMLAERVLGQRIRLTANPKYWRKGEPVLSEAVFTVFSDNASASAALESGAVDMIYGGGGRDAVRLRAAGYQLIQGPGPLVQVFRINTTQGPFRNEKYRQAFNFLMDRAAILRVGYAGLGEVTALPWAPSSPAADRSYDKTYGFDIDKAKALLKESGLSAAEQSDWKLLVNSSDEDSVRISQVVQSTLAKAGINIQLDLKGGSEFVDALLGGKFAAVFGGVGNVQKFPSRVATNSIYRTVKNPVLGDPNPHKGYVAAIDRVNTTLGSGAPVKAAYDALNKALVEASFGIPTNTYDVFLIVAGKNVAGFTPDIDNLLVLRTVGFKP